MDAEARFSLQCSKEDVPGIGNIHGERARNQAILICAADAPYFSAMAIGAPKCPNFSMLVNISISSANVCFSFLPAGTYFFILVYNNTFIGKQTELTGYLQIDNAN